VFHHPSNIKRNRPEKPKKKGKKEETTLENRQRESQDNETLRVTIRQKFKSQTGRFRSFKSLTQRCWPVPRKSIECNHQDRIAGTDPPQARLLQISISLSLTASLGSCCLAGQISRPSAFSRWKCSVMTSRTWDWKCRGPSSSSELAFHRA
jgi:hypothetical protein